MRACCRGECPVGRAEGMQDTGPLAQLEVVCTMLGVEVELYDVGEPRLVPVVVAVLSRPDGSQLTLGSAAGWDVRRAAERAVCEALMLQWTLARCSATTAGWDQPTSSLEHVLAAARRGPAVRDWYRRQAQGFRRCGPIPPAADGSEPASLVAFAEQVRKHLGGEVVKVHLGAELTRDSGWSVQRVLISGAQPRESDSRSMHLGGRRLLEANRKWNRSAEPLQQVAHPFG
jgi:ribosomal protein S12 methylthiotransferase accessory factor YcaO